MCLLVYRLTYNGDVVAFKRAAAPAAAGRQEGTYLNRSVTDPQAHFQRNPPGRDRLASARKAAGHFQGNPRGRGRLAVFLVARSLKNSQLIRGLPDDLITVCNMAQQVRNTLIS